MKAFKTPNNNYYRKIVAQNNGKVKRTMTNRPDGKHIDLWIEPPSYGWDAQNYRQESGDTLGFRYLNDKRTLRKISRD